MPLFAAFRSTVKPLWDRIIAAGDRWLVDPVTGAVVGVKNPNAGGADARFIPVDLTAAQISAPTALMLADLDATFRLNVAPYTRYYSNGTALVEIIAEADTLVSRQIQIRAPLPADVDNVVTAVTPSNVALTIAAQPAQARKLQIDIVIGTPPTTEITAGVLTLVGTDIDGNTIGQIISLITDADLNIVTGYAYASLTSATITGYAAAGSGTGNTISLGVTDDFALPTGIGTVSDLTITKATIITTDFTGGTVVAADDDASAATVDETARTVEPGTAPETDGLIDYEITYSYRIN